MRALARRAHAFAAYDVPFDGWARRPHSTGRQDVICDAGAFAHHTLLESERAPETAQSMCLMSAEKVANAKTAWLIWLAVIPNFMAKAKTWISSSPA